MKQKTDINKFNVSQMFNDKEGKTSGMLFISIFACFNATMCFVVVGNIIAISSVYSMISKEPITQLLPPDITALLNNLLLQSLGLFAMGATGLGIRRLTADKIMQASKDSGNTGSENLDINTQTNINNGGNNEENMAQ